MLPFFYLIIIFIKDSTTFPFPLEKIPSQPSQREGGFTQLNKKGCSHYHIFLTIIFLKDSTTVPFPWEKIPSQPSQREGAFTQLNKKGCSHYHIFLTIIFLKDFTTVSFPLERVRDGILLIPPNLHIQTISVCSTFCNFIVFLI